MGIEIYRRTAVVSLFDVTGKMVQPWLDAGYEAWIVDVQHPVAYETGGVTTEGRLHKVHADLTRPWLPPPTVSSGVNHPRWRVGQGC